MINLEERIALVKAMKEFAVNLGIPRDDSFEKLEEYPMIYALVVSRRDRIESPFEDYPFGAFGFFDQDEAKIRQQRYEREGFDTYLTEGRSTGPTDDIDLCPLTESLVTEDLVRMSLDVFHEMFHIKGYSIGRAKRPFIEEPMAFWFSYKAVNLFYKGNQPLLQEIEKTREYDLLWGNFILDCLLRLQEAYQVGEREGRELLNIIGEEDEHLNGVNNAFFLDYYCHLIYMRETSEIVRQLSAEELVREFKKWYRKIQLLTGHTVGDEEDQRYVHLIFGQNLLKMVSEGTNSPFCNEVGKIRMHQLFPNGLALPIVRISDNPLNLGDDAYIVQNGTMDTFFEVTGIESQQRTIILSELLKTAKPISKVRNDNGPYSWIKSLENGL